MKTFPTYFKFGAIEHFYRDLSSDEARDEYFATEEIDLYLQNGGIYTLDRRYEAPMFKDGKYYFIFKEKNA